MKKKIIIIAICFTFVLLVLPMKYTYKDGGTKEYRAVLYNIIKWHSIDNNYENGYKTGTELHFFPANLRRIDFYKNTIPQRMELFYNDNRYYANTLNYSWCNQYDNYYSREVLLIKNVDFKDSIKTNKDQMIKLMSPASINNVVIYKGTLDNMYSQNIEYTDEYIKTPNEKGDYVYILHCKNGKNKVDYLFKVIVQ